jgi:hypothetical protein
VVILTELRDNTGQSVTNSVEQLAAEILAALKLAPGDSYPVCLDGGGKIRDPQIQGRYRWAGVSRLFRVVCSALGSQPSWGRPRLQALGLAVP